MKVDREGGAASALHVSPAVGSTSPLAVEAVGAVLDTDAGVNPGARGTAGLLQGRETNAVSADKLEY